jgi:hypothetical protein
MHYDDPVVDTESAKKTGIDNAALTLTATLPNPGTLKDLGGSVPESHPFP